MFFVVYIVRVISFSGTEENISNGVAAVKLVNTFLSYV